MNTPLKLALPALLFLSFFQGPALRTGGPAADPGAFCAQAELHRQKMQTDATYRLASQRMEDELYTLALQNSQSGHSTGRGPLVQHTLPVVVHIIHDGGNENISDALVDNALQHLNDAFANVGYYNPATGVDTEIAFCLARRDPEGNATTGINRVQSVLTNMNSSIEDQAMKDLSRWDPTQYINVWVVNAICNNNGCSVAGYAYLPGAHGQPYDGIVLEAAYMGSNPTNSTVLVHEMGHYLGLYHTFEGGCPNDDCQQQGDRICDTPPDNTTARTPCSADMNSCNTDEDDTSANNPFRPIAQGGLGDQVDMKENYMDYSRLECYDRFSQGQKQRMLNVAETIRSSLLDSPACIDPCPSPVEAGFFADNTTVPVGATVNFTNTSSNGDSFEWLIDGTVFSTAVNASYNFTTEGTYLITLETSSNLSNCLPTDSTITIEVFCPVQASFSASDTSVLAGGSVTFTNTSANATGYTWLVNGVEVSNATEYVLNTTEPGLFNVCLQAEGPFCESLECQFVEASSPTSDNGCGNTFFYTLGSRDASETAGCIIPSADGGFYLGGSRNNKPLLMKFDESENVLWQKTFSISNSPNVTERVLTLLEDGPYLAGAVILNEDDQYCFKYDTNTETFVWLRAITNLENNRTYEILNIDGSPTYTIIGYVGVTGGDGCDVTWGELDKNTGNIVQFDKHHLGSCETGLDAIHVGARVYVTGRYNAAGDGTYAMRPAITEFNLDGTESWTRLYLVNTDATARLYSNAIIQDNTSLVVCGYGDLTGTSTTSVVGHIYKTAINGSIEWATAIDIPGGDTERFVSIVDQADGYLAVGYYTLSGGSEALCFVKVDKSGNLMWAKTLNSDGPERISPKAAFARSGYAYFASTLSLETGSDIHLLKVNPAGELVGDCIQLQRLEVEAWPLADPFDGFFSLSSSPFTPVNTTGQSSPADVVIPTDTLCYEPCEEICANGMDDDSDGLADCEDPDCDCFQDCGNTFVKTIGGPTTVDGATAIVEAGDGAFYIGGYLDEEAMIAKATSNGELLWVRTFDFTDRPDHIISLFLDSDGFLVGTSFGDANTGSFGRGATAFRYDPENDQLLWVNYFNSRGTPNQIIANPANGNFFFAGGDILTTGGGNADNASLAELDRNTGDVLWRKEFNIGSSDRFFSLLPVGNVLYALGRYTIGSGFEKMRVGLAAFTGAGNLEWSKYYIINATSNARMYGPSLQIDAGELAATFYGDLNGTDLDGSSDSGIMKTDLAGRPLWVKFYRLAGYPSLQSAFQLVVVPDGYLLYGYAISGDRDLVVIKTNKQGNALWAKAYGGPADEDLFYSFCTPPILQSGDNIYFVGRSRDGSDDALFVKALIDGSLGSDDCDFVRDVSVTTFEWLGMFEADANLQEQPNPDINPQLQSVQAGTAEPDCSILCEASPNDLTVALDSAYCNGDSLAVDIRICNEGTDTLVAGAPFTFYDGNPTANPAATVLAGGFTTAVDILSGECYSATVSVPYPQEQLYCIVNDDGTLAPVFNLETDFPPTGLIECDYTNNIDSAGYETTAPDINLGPDTSVCENGVFLLDAGPGFATYRWQDGAIGQTYTTFETGTFWVEATTACGGVASDTIEIRLDTVIAISLRPDTTLCAGDSISFSPPQAPAYTYQWSPAATLDCTDCPAVTASPDSTTTYNLVVSNPTGCFSVDSVTITVESCIATLDTAICLGDSLLIEGQVLYPNEMDTLQLPDGSSLFVNVSALDTFFLALDLGACPGETAEYNGVQLQPGQSERFTFTTANGCDSTVEVTALQLDTFSTTLDTAVCRGQSLEYNGALLPAGQSETFQFTAANGCDSTVLVNVSPLDTFYLAIGLGVCAGDSVEYGGVTLLPGQSEQVTFTTVNGCDSTVEVTALQLDTFLTAIDTAICEGQSIDYNGVPVPAGQSEAFTFTAANGCDSTVLFTVNPIDTSLQMIAVEACFGEPYLYEGMELTGGTTTPFIYTGANGCDSTVLVAVTELEEIQTYDTLQVCQGETGEVFGQPVTEPGVYSENYLSSLGCDSTHNINFIVQDTAVLQLNPGQLSCTTLSGSLTVVANGGQPPYTYLWSDGQTTATADGLAAGAYSVTVTGAAGCQSIGVQQVTSTISRPAAEAVGIPVSCFGDQDGAILVDNAAGGTPPYEYSIDGQQWQADNLFTGLLPGGYIVFIRDQEQCQEFYSIAVGAPTPLGIFLPADTTLRLGDSIRLDPITLSGSPSAFEWDPPLGLDCADCPNPIAHPTESTLYRLTVQDNNGCLETAEIFIDVDNTLRLYLPNAFSPNEDGRNDAFTVFAGSEVVEVQTLQVFGRWGEQVFKRDNFAPNQESLGWDGAFRGQLMPPGVYAYFAEVVLADGRVEVVKGEVVLVR